jgi:hypothetical protein
VQLRFARSSLPHVAAGLVFSAALAPACGGRNDGVNDVAQACAIRAQWKNDQAKECLNCRASVGSPPCDCTEFKAYAGKCEPQAGEARAACPETFETCARSCKQDCTCLSKCYDGNAACKNAAAARDGCLTDVCTAVCK